MEILVLCLSFGLAGGVVGRIKGSSFVLWFLVSGLMPVLGLLAALAYRFDSEELRRQCPGCGKVVKLHDAICTTCGTELEFPDVAIVSEAEARRRAKARAAGAAGAPEQAPPPA